MKILFSPPQGLWVYSGGSCFFFIDFFNPVESDFLVLCISVASAWLVWWSAKGCTEISCDPVSRQLWLRDSEYITLAAPWVFNIAWTCISLAVQGLKLGWVKRCRHF